MLFLTQSAAVYGIDALIVDIEVNLQPVKGEADTTSPVLIVGLPDTAIRESRERYSRRHYKQFLLFSVSQDDDKFSARRRSQGRC
ncbi:MAG: hypothetical protein M3525_14655 [Acidobacteriota bacterium]|nr:hypothetical protein [Acidobacteriota bacterium]